MIARNKNGINVWPTHAIAIASAAETEGERVFGRMTIWPNRAAAVSNIEYPVSGGESPEAYTTGAVHFDGAAWLANAALIASVDPDSVSFSFWVRAGAQESIFPFVCVNDAADSYGSQIIFAGNAPDTGKLQFAFNNAGSTLYARGQTSNVVTTDQWLHVLGAVETDAVGAKAMKIYITDADSGVVDTDSEAAFTMAYNGLSFLVGGDSYEGDAVEGDIADFWFAPGVSLLTAGDIPEATRRKFISALGKPVDLGADGSTPTGTAPAIFLHRDVAAAASTFANNLGTGGAFTITGTLTNAGTSPSD